MKTYFETPTQVLYYNPEDTSWCGGIAYKDEIICACCGGIFEIDEIITFGSNLETDPILPYIDWIDFTEEICGGPSDIQYHIEGE